MITNDTTIDVETKTTEWTKWEIGFNTLKIYITIYYNYQLLYCKEHIHIMSNNNIINVE